MKIVVDENIAHGATAFAQFGDVVLAPGRGIDRALLSDAGALIVRSITTVDRALLEGTPVRFVGTATIGADHVDLDYLKEGDIAFASAQGAGARSVAEYVVAALLVLRRRGLVDPTSARLGLIGVGSIGSTVARFARLLGLEVVEYDPPRDMREREFVSASLHDVLACDLISVHVPLVHSGPHATEHMIDAEILERVNPSATLINVARGGVVESTALGDALRRGRLRTAVLDVWEGEPEVPVELLNRCALATPHIAGYSFDGKLKGTEMVADAMAAFCGTTNGWRASDTAPPVDEPIVIDTGAVGEDPLDVIGDVIHAAYDIEKDDAALRATFGFSPGERRAEFDRLRKTYPKRREFTAYEVRGAAGKVRETLAGLGFGMTAPEG